MSEPHAQVFVTEPSDLRTQIVRGIHHMSWEGSMVRVFTYEVHDHGVGIERRLNGDRLMAVEDLVIMIGQVADFLQSRPLLGPLNELPWKIPRAAH